MSKAILEYDLPEDNSAFLLATNGYKYWSCLLQITDEIRRKLKNDNEFTNPEDALNWVRDMITEEIDLYEID